MKVYSNETVYSESVKYFDGDEFAASTWMNKYALKTENGEFLESNPKMMHDRIIKEILRIENKYPEPVLTKEILQELLYDFKYLIPGGSVMSGLGNPYRHTSLSNCFVIEPPLDSYGGICKTDQEMVQLAKRRGGVGTDLSNLRPNGSSVTNDAKSSSGLVSFMERYSNSIREVGQNGRRGALMLSVSILHPDAEGFIDAKTDLQKVTGANISVKVTDDFMKIVTNKDNEKNNYKFVQVFPITKDPVEIGYDPDQEYELGKLYEGSKPNTYFRVINARKLWNKLMFNNWKFAEPGIIFWDKIKSESPADFYGKDWETVGTNPCGEIPLCPHDSCRLLAINLYSFVKNPFEKNASIDYDKLGTVSHYAMRFMDDLMDLESEHIQDIIKKIENDPEPEEYKSIELNLWKKILHKTLMGRRTGIGITAEGDMLAAINQQYASLLAITTASLVHRTIATEVYRESINLARVRGTFEVYSIKEIDTKSPNCSEFIKRLYTDKSNHLEKDWIKYGRRNIACLTIAPTGTVSIMTRTTSGIEPVFRIYYKRRRKTSDKSKAVFIDKTGDMFEEFNIVHPKFIDWYRIAYNNGDNLKYSYAQCKSILENLPSENLDSLIESSPYKGSTANDIDWNQKVKMQGSIQMWVDHSISCTVNIPKETTVELVNDIYLTAWNYGCKGITIYRDGSRDGVLITKDSSEKSELLDFNKPRPEELPAKIVRFKNGSENWIAFVGIFNERPYEIFCGKVDDDIRYLPKSVSYGTIIKIDSGTDEDGRTKHRYDFIYEITYGYKNTLPAINEVFKEEYWNYARLISGMLRGGIPVASIVNVLQGMKSDMGNSINTWKKGVTRALKGFVKDGVKSGNLCPECGTELVYQGGCTVCPSCGHSKCE